jgi:hypothetical protein
VGIPLSESEKIGEDCPYAAEIMFDVCVGEKPAAFILAGRVADPRCSAAHERDWPMAGLLQPVQHHDRQ